MPRKKVCVAPFTVNEIAIVKYLDGLSEDYCISSFLFAKGFTTKGIDLSSLNNKEDTGILGTLDVDEAFGKADIIVITDQQVDSPIFRFAERLISIALEKKKDVVCCLTLTDDKRISIKKEFSSNGLEFLYIQPEEYANDVYTNLGDPLYAPICPVIFVGELAEKVEGYEVFCGLANELKQKGKKICCVSSDKYNALLGFHYIDFFRQDYDIRNITTKINQQFQQLCEIEYPEFIIVKLPNPMIKYSDDVIYDSGATSYILSQALTPNYFVVCATYGYTPMGLWESMSNNFTAKFGYPIDCIHMSNKFPDTTDQAVEGTLSYVHIAEKEQMKLINDMYIEFQSKIIYNLTNQNELQLLGNTICEQLLGQPYKI